MNTHNQSSNQNGGGSGGGGGGGSSSTFSPIVLTSTYRLDVQEKYTFSYEIGSGTYGMVYKADDKKRPNNKVAVKKFRSTKEGEGLSLTAYREIGVSIYK